jgi:phosphatidylcholine synthase
MTLARLYAWAAHFYTATGLIVAAAIATLIVQGGAGAFRWAFALMLVAVLIDSTDGMLARLAKAKEVLPDFDGRRLDDIIDFLNYTFLPLLLIWRAEILPARLSWCLLLPLVASAYGFCQLAAKTEDGYFLGFPSYWNLVAFYLYVLKPSDWMSLSLLVFLAMLTFVPSRYLYPSQRGRFNTITNLLAGSWVVLAVWILYRLPAQLSAASSTVDAQTWWLALASLYFPVFYMITSWVISIRMWLATQKQGT